MACRVVGVACSDEGLVQWACRVVITPLSCKPQTDLSRISGYAFGIRHVDWPERVSATTPEEQDIFYFRFGPRVSLIVFFDKYTET